MRRLVHLATALLAFATLFAAVPAAAQIDRLSSAISGTSFGLGANKIDVAIGTVTLGDTHTGLLPLRGWALPGRKAAGLTLPLGPFSQLAQRKHGRPALQIDNGPGYFGKLSWDAPSGAHVELFQYDSRSNPEAVHPTLQWGSDTNFSEIGVRLPFGHRKWEVRAQGLTGSTQAGAPMPSMIWIDTSFRAAYGMVTRRFHHGSASVRAEWFGTRNNGSMVTSQEDENGWALTGAAKRDLGHGLIARAEIMHTESTRNTPIYFGHGPTQRQTVAQISLRLSV